MVKSLYLYLLPLSCPHYTNQFTILSKTMLKGNFGSLTQRRLILIDRCSHTNMTAMMSNIKISPWLDIRQISLTSLWGLLLLHWPSIFHTPFRIIEMLSVIMINLIRDRCNNNKLRARSCNVLNKIMMISVWLNNKGNKGEVTTTFPYK